MDRLADLSCSDRTLGEASSTPFDAVFVRLSKAEHIELVRAVNYWKTEHARAAERARRIEALYEERMRQAAGEAAQREAALRAQLDVAEGKVRDLQQRLFGRKSERSSVIDGKHRHRADGTGRRGQRPGAKGHGRSRAKQLPVEAEEVKLESPACPKCGEALKPFPGTEDSELVEIEVRAYRRVIRRQRYRPSCGCKALPGIVTAAPEPRLIPRGKFGISVWVTVLLDKFLYGRPSYRLVQDLADHGLDLPMGTLSGGLQAIAPLFVPVCEALREELRRGRHWHAHETRWEVFADTEGKIGHRWYLWVFKSSSVTFFVLDPSRSAAVVNDVLGGLDGGTISCDRYGAYKKFARLNTGFTLLFCWVHQRRDLLNLANDHPELASWALAWVEFIGEMFAVHAQRAEAAAAGRDHAELDRQLREAIGEMARKREAALADATLPTAAVKVLQSMARHWVGLTSFLDQPELPLDNNAAERALRPAVIGRKNFYGSGSHWSAELAAMMFSILMTLRHWTINPHTWLSAYLQACAEHGNQAPPDLSAFLPWTMDAQRLQAMRSLFHHRPTGVDSS